MLLLIVNNGGTFKIKQEEGLIICQRMKNINAKCIYISILVDKLS